MSLVRQYSLLAGVSIGLFALSLGLGGCTAPSRTVRLGILGGTQTLWRYVAQRRDELLKPLRYQVTFDNYETEAELQQAFTEQKLDVIATLPTALPRFAEQGLSVQFFLPIAWIGEGYPLVTRADAALRSIPDLRGKQVAFFPMEHPGTAYWRAMLWANYGLQLPQAFTVLESLSPEVLLVLRQADAAIMASPTWSILKQEGTYLVSSDLAAEWRKIRPGDRPLMFGGYLARREWVEANKGFVEDFIRLHRRALEEYRKDRAAFLSAAAQYQGDKTPPLTPADHEAIAHYLGYNDVPPDRVFISAEDIADQERLFILLAQVGYLRTPPKDVASLFYQSSRVR